MNASLCLIMIGQYSLLKRVYYLGFMTRYKQGNKAQMKDVRRSSENETGDPFTVHDYHRSLPGWVPSAL